MTAGSIPVPTVVPLRVPGPGESKFNIDTNTRVELRSVVPASENVSIYYTINGTRPDPSGKVNHLHKSTYMYSGPFTLPPGKVVLKAVACLPDGKESGVNTKTLHVTFVDNGHGDTGLLEDNETSFRKAVHQTPSLVKNKSTASDNWIFNEALKAAITPDSTVLKEKSYPDPYATSKRNFSPQRSLKREKSDLSFELNTNRFYPNLAQDLPPKTTQTAMRVSRETDFLRCICCFAKRPADPNAKFCNECGYPCSPLTEKQLPPPEPGQMGQCIKCQSTVPLNTDKCVVCEFDLAEQFQPQATLRTADKKKCFECGALNPPSVQFCLKCEEKLDSELVKVKSNLERPPVNTSALLLDDDCMMSCSKCGRVNSIDARFCDWCGTKPKHPSPLSRCLKCSASNQPYARFCSTCGAVLEAPERPDPRNTGLLLSGMPVKDAIKSLDSRATPTWLPMTAKAPAKTENTSVQTQTVGLFYPSTKAIEKYLAEDESKKVFKEEKKIPLSAISPGKGYWRQNVDFIANHLKAHSQNDMDFRKMIGEHKLGKLMSATIHEDGHEFSLVLNFPIRSNRSDMGSGKLGDPFKGKNMSIFKNTVVGGYPVNRRGGGVSGDEVDSDTDPSDIETAVHSLVSQKDKDIFGNTKHKLKPASKKKASAGKKESKQQQENSHLSSVNRLLFTEVGPKGSGDVDTVAQLLSEDGAEINCINSANESLLVVALKNKREECVNTLISHGIDVNRKLGTQGNTPLHEAILLGNSGESIVQALLGGGANSKRKNDKGKTPIELATEKGYERIITVLVASLGQEMLDKEYDQNTAVDEINY
ncbi:double zinc ribbon and ankyrin repeat-containing protein 1-like [Convolutriloba macropyga]|uniref:double zinc ribbon and ankyrin repeat-containing protein 1-like n=1 Tax=Convolutriloba macropyga TaxID=536237 RepID=UPI003F528952